MPKSAIAKKTCKPAGGWRPPKDYAQMGFADFVVARQRVLENRRASLPREQWTDDLVLLRARFCNIDRRDDFVTAELLAENRARPTWGLRERVLLAAALRFTGSRRGEAATIAALIEAGAQLKDRDATPLRAALAADEIKCGAGTYQLSLNRRQVASKIEEMAQAVVPRIEASGPFADVLEASDCVAELMTVGKRPQFSANETAKDFAYVDGMMHASSAHRCRLGPGAKKGLTLVRALQRSELSGSSDEAAVEKLRGTLRARKGLAWVEAIDVEQALCEFSKYEAYCSGGVSASKAFAPAS